MKHFNWRQLIPHAIAVVIFLVIAVIYCRPALEGKVLQQNDIIHWKGMAQNAFEYKEKHGHFPLWNTNLFSGMPNYQVAMENKSLLPDFGKIITLGLPKPANYFFLACLCFYILCMAFGTNYLIAVLASLAFAYSTYDPIIISVGHESKMLAIGCMPGLLAGLVLIYERRYIIGLAATAFFASFEIGANHPQMNYYFLIVALFMTASYAIRWIQTKQWQHLAIALSLALLGALIGVGNSAVALMTTAEYAKYTMRGGKSIEASGNDIKQVKTTGLDEDYGFSYSNSKTEFLTFMMPHAFGESSGKLYDENSKIVTALTDKNVPENSAIQVASSLPKYWGGMSSPNESTSGPVYLGALICILFIIGFAVTDNKYRWWILAASAFAVIIAWGKYFAGFNSLLFQHLPLYNKFRAPSMALVIPQLLFPLLAALGLQQIFFADNFKTQLQQNFKKILYAVGGVFLFIILVYLFNDYSSGFDKDIIKGYSDQSGNSEFGKIIVNAMMDERKAAFGADLLRALLFATAAIAGLYLYIKNILKPVVIIAAFAIINTADLLAYGSNYLSTESYIEPDTYQSENFTPSPAVAQILKDKSLHYRVYNLGGDRFNESLNSYFVRCIGGYHPAKLRIYQDLIENQLAKNNTRVINMLDTKYFIIPAQQQQGQPVAQINDSAMGACWFVKEVKFVNGPAEEMKALDNFDPAATAIADNSFRNVITQQPAYDSSAKITLTSYDNDDIKYAVTCAAPQFAVLSEIYYPEGWEAFIDGKKVDYCKVNYVLRGLPVLAGRHDIEFKFHPSSYYSGQTIIYIANILLWLSITAAVWFVVRRKPA